MRILHIVPDEKFIDGLISNWDSLNDVENIYCVLGHSDASTLKYITRCDRVVCAVFESSAVMGLLRDCQTGKIHAVIFHSLCPSWELFSKSCRPARRVMVFWGYEIYGMTNKVLTKPCTKKTVSSASYSGGILRLGWRSVLRIYNRILRNRYIPLLPLLRKVQKEIDLIGVLMPCDYEMLVASYPYIKFPAYALFRYGYICSEFYASRVGVCSNKNGGILINNSSSMSGNHIDILYKLSKLNIKNKIIVPLSYGDIQYRKTIIRFGKALFGSRFVPICDFMAYTDYTKLIGSCDYMIMGHLRQQALGNITLGLAQGLKIFLWKDSPIYKSYYASGMHISTIDEMTASSFSAGLSESFKKENCDLIADMWGKAAWKQMTIAFINSIKQLEA